MTKYCTEFEAVNAIPNPSHSLRAAAATAETAATNNKTKNNSLRPKPRVMPRRFYSDDFTIQELSNQSVEASSLPIMTTKIQTSRNFDLNTAWVEMLIHEQQQVQAAIA